MSNTELSKLLPIRKTGNIDNEREQINKALRALQALVESLDLSDTSTIQQQIDDLQAQIDNLDQESSNTTEWGQIGGSIPNQTDLQDELDAKLDEIYAHHKKADSAPGSNPDEGGMIYYTLVSLDGAIKTTEHWVRDARGNDTIVLSFSEAI